MNFILGGHRGLGCTDHDFYQDKRDIAALPVENTLESIKAAFAKGAAYIETDAVMSADGVIFTLHNVVPKDHFFGTEKPVENLNKLPFSQITQYKTGRHSNGMTTPFQEVLDMIAQIDPQTADWVINIEIKGVQGSGQPFEYNNFINRLATCVLESKIPVQRILFSSFSLQNIIDMSQRLPHARYGMLFAERDEMRPIYADHQDDFKFRYLPFISNMIDMVDDTWKEEAHPEAVLSYMHPEIDTITQDTIQICSKQGFGINCWALFEHMTPERLELYKRTQKVMDEQNVPFTIITDYLDTFLPA